MSKPKASQAVPAKIMWIAKPNTPPARLTVFLLRLHYLFSSMAKPRPPRVPDIAVAFRELPGTSVGFWVVAACPFCGAQHFHAAGAGKSDPFEKLGEVEARCGQGRYVIGLPPKPKRKKERRAENKRARKAQSGAWDEPVSGDRAVDDWDE